MLKKIFVGALMLTAILFVGNAKVSAQDVWIYSGGGTDYYVVTETFNSRQGYHFDVDVKYVRGSVLVAVKKYSFDGYNFANYKIDGVAQGSIFDSAKRAHVQPAYNIFGYSVNHFGVTDKKK
ncbi:MAG: hypothetical protein IJ685_05450 [Selenomonadaceae bacterium]|nr:hypothetical protein [Selenomonadaceae bacterium]